MENVLLIISLVSTLPNYFPFKIHLKYPIFFSEPGCGRATPARSPPRWGYPLCRFCSQGAKPPRTPTVVLRPLSPPPPCASGLDAERGRPQLSKSIDLRLPAGAKPPHTPAIVYRPPTLRNRIEFVQVGFFGCTLVSCTGFFGCKHHHTKFTKIITKTRKKENSIGC